MHEANAAAATFFRQELLRTEALWPAALLESWGVNGVLDPGSVWQIGYAPDGGARLVDCLQEKGFGRETLLQSGLASWTDDGRVVDRYRDQLVEASYDQRLEPVGFVGIDRDGQARPITPETPVHRRSEALVGVLEQIDVLEAGATAVIVDHPLDAAAIELGSRRGGKEYVGIPLCGTPISKGQASMLRQYSVTDRVIVTVPAEPAAGQRAFRSAVDLAGFFDHARLLECPPGPLLANPERLEFLADLYLEMPAAGSRGDLAHRRDLEASLEIEDRGPGLSP